jgi:hypothetical protein
MPWVDLHGKYGRGRQTWVDEIDYTWVMQWAWKLYPNPRGYECVLRSERREGIFRHVRLATEIALRMGLDLTDRTVDHIDQDPLNQARSNLRAATFREQHQNQPLVRDNTTGYRGVSLNEGKYPCARALYPDGRQWSRNFSTVRRAALAYDVFQLKHYPDYVGPLNFPHYRALIEHRLLRRL